MNTAETQLKRILDKLQVFIKLYQQAQKENLLLRDEIKNLQEEQAVTEEKLAMLRQQTEVLKYANGEMDATEKKAFEKRINGYLSEIDRCITMLNS